jgi:hypothetical protein
VSYSFEFGLRRVRTAAVLAVLFLAAGFLPRAASAQMSVVGSVSPRQLSYIGTATFSASASGGDSATTRYAFFRRRPGGTWIPDINGPAWQSGSSYNWNPTLSDVGVWETYVWVKDGNTPANQNTYGYAAGHNSQPIEVFGPPTPPGPTTVSCDYTGGGECWVTGDFVASVSASTGGLGSLNYQICRSNDTTGWGGCDVNLTLTGGTSITVSGSHLPADGYRRAYYFQTRDSGGAYSGWNSPKFVRVDRYAPSVSASNASSLWYSNRTATISAGDSGSGVQSVRYSWNSSLSSSCTTGTSTSSGATLTAPAGDNVLYVCAKDNTSRVGQWSGSYRVSPLGLSGSVSPSQASYLSSFTYTASASGGTPSTTRFAFFHRRPGGTWIPDVNNPPWQAGNVYTWTPTSSDTGTWETYIWVKDGDTPAGMNGYGYAAGLNTGPITVLGPPTVPGPTTAACAYTASGECWVQGDFTASVTASTGGSGSLVYQICRSNDTAGFGGCDVNLTLTGGTSILVSGTHLPADGYRRAFYFQAKDSGGAYSGWNTPLYVRVDRYAPTISATNASDVDWYYSRTATVSASDAHSGVQSVRYSWNAALDAACTTGTATSSGASLTAPVGDNTLYLCAKDNTGRVAQWSGRYRVAAGLSLTGCSVSPAQGSYTGTFTYAATASGGIPSTTRFAFFHRRPGGTWIPDVNAPTWLASNTYPWNPSQADAGTWETYIWVKDGNTPPTQNVYGYAAGCNPGPITVVGPPTVPGPTTVSCNYTTADDCWVQGDFTASVTASTGGSGSLVYQICRSNDTAGSGGCDVNLTLTGGTSILVSGTHLPADSYRRSYWFQAKDSSGALSGWNTPRYVRVDRYAPTVSASNASDTVWFSHRMATVTASDTGGSGLQGVRYNWSTALDAACTTGTATSSGAVLTAPPGDNLLYLCAKDNTGRVTQWNGRYRVSPLGLTGTVTPKPASYQETVTYTATATGGTPATIRYAFFRRRPGSPTWIPDVTVANWQAGNTFTWQLASTDTGTWETYIWVKDGDTPATMNTNGFAAGFNTQPIDIVGAPTVPGPTTVSCAYTAAGDCWVQGDFTASVTASTGGKGSLVYQICRSNDTTGFGGCEVNLTLTGGTSILVSGTHLPSDGFRRAYYFQAKDSSGALSGWNTPRYVWVDRNAPTVSAANASDSWFRSRTATISASDAGSGLQGVRYSWNTALDAGCTTGTATATGTALTAPNGDNLLYLCAKDNTARVTQWNGRYKVAASPTLTVTQPPATSSYLNPVTWTVTPTGGVPGTIEYLIARHRTGSSDPWITSAWQSSNVFTWQPSLADVGPWDHFVLVRDSLTAPDENGGGYSATANAGKVEIVGKPAKVTSASPKLINQGTTTMLTVTGENLQGATVYIATQPDEGKPATINPFPAAELNEISPDGTWLTVIIDASEPGIEGWQNLAINTPGGKTAAQFRVVGTAPIVDVYTPSQPVQGNIHILMLAGVNLMGAEVVPTDPSVKVLDLDNSKDHMLMGLLYVDSDGPVGATEIRVESPGGESLSLLIDVAGSADAASITTTELEIPGRSGLADVPNVLMQTPVTSSSLLPVLGYRQPGEPADGSGIRGTTGQSFEICGFVSMRESFEERYILLGLTDPFSNKPLTRQILNKLKPGQRLDFNSLTVAARAFLEFELYFKICQNWTTLAYACVRGELNQMVPVVGGYRLAFDYCYGTEGPKVKLAAEGFISKQEWSSSSSCVTVKDKTSEEEDPDSPEYGSGDRRGQIQVDCCTPANVSLHINAQALGTNYNVQGQVMSVNPENCTNPGPPELRVFLDVDGDNVKPDPEYLYEPSELDDSGRYLPCSPLGGTSAPPGAGLLPSQLPQLMPLRAAYVRSYNGKLKIVPPPAGITSVEINLQNTSMLAGIATNYPIDFTGGPGSGNQDPDFWLAASGDSSGGKADTVTASFDGSMAAINLLCNDYGGSTSIRARPLPEGAFTTALALPATSLGSRLPSIGWTAVSGNPVQATENVDGDQMPAGTGQTGDGLSVTSEYRGVVIDGRHYRLDPGKKDLFVMWDAAFADGGTTGLGLQIHRPRPGEVWENSGILAVNIHGMSNSLESDMVVAVALVNDDQSPLPPYSPNNPPSTLGFTKGTVSLRGAAPVTSTMQTRRISQYRDQYPQKLPLAGTINWVYSHEIGHAVDICHREEDEQGNALPDPNCEPGTEIDPESVIPHGVFFMHSGAIFRRIGLSTNGLAAPATAYHLNSLKQIKLK